RRLVRRRSGRPADRHAQAGGPREGHGLQRGERAGTLHGARGRRASGHRRRSEDARHPRRDQDRARPLRECALVMPAPTDGRQLRIAIVKLSSLGDVIHALPLARALRQAYPTAHLTWIVEAREYAILRDHPDLDSVLPVDTRLWRRLIRRPAGARIVWQKLARLRTRIRAARFDVTVDVQGLIKSGVLTAYTGAPVRVGFSPSWCGEWPNALFTNRHVTPPVEAVHVVEQYLALLSSLGIVTPTPEFHVPARHEAERRMDEFLGEQGIKRQDVVVALNPGAGRENKRWPVSNLSALAERLGSEPDVRLLLLWGPDEIHMA